MTDEFKQNRQAFEELADMAEQERGYSRIAKDFVHPDWKLPEDERPSSLSGIRWTDYRKRFNKLNLEAGVTIYDNAIVLERSSSGAVTSGSSKGYLRAPDVPASIKIFKTDEDLNCELGEDSFCSVAKPLDDIWYIILERH